jgi:AcrR family transcriptional regulator
MGKAETRQRLIAAALELAATKGFDAVTVADIAQRASVSEMTFFRHFPSKAAVMIEDPYDPLIAQAILDRPAAESAWAATLRGIGDAWAQVPPPAAGEVRERLAIVAATPSLRGALREGSAATTAAISHALEERGASAQEATVIAAAVVAALNEALLMWAAGGGDLDAAITGALSILESR